MRVGESRSDARRNRLIDARAHARVAHHWQIVTEQIPVRRADRADGARVRERRVGDVQLPLPESVDAQRLLVDVGAQPVVEDAEAPAQRRLPVLERRPGHAESRPEIVVVTEVGLQLVTDTRTERQVFPQADVILHINPSLDVVVVDGRIAQPPGVVQGQSRLERGRTVKQVGAQVVGLVVREV